MRYHMKKKKKLKPLVFLVGIILSISIFLPISVYEASILSKEQKLITFKYEDFSDTKRNGFIQLNKHANIKDNYLRLTPALNNRSGSAFYKERVSLTDKRSFSTYFTFKIHGGTGADGLVFVIQTESNNAGTEGSGIGYGGISPSLGIEFDTYENSHDPNANHVGVNLGGSVESKKTATPNFNLRENVRYAWIDYNGESNTLEVYLNDNKSKPTTSLLTYDVDLTEELDMDEVYVGFTAATGGLFDNHDVLSWYFNNYYDPIDIEQYSYINAPTQVKLTSELSDDGESSTITATVKDENDVVVPNQEVAFTSDSEAVTLSSTTVMTNENGVATVEISGEGYATIKAVANGGMYKSIDVTLGKYTVHFDSNDGSIVDPINVIYGTQISKPKDPTRSGYTFKGWYKDKYFSNAFEFEDAEITANMTLYAKWVDETPPEITLSAPTEETNQDVTITVSLIELGSGIEVTKWANGSKDETYFSDQGTVFEETFKVSENGIYTVYAKDKSGNKSVKTIEITNIDKTITFNIPTISKIGDIMLSDQPTAHTADMTSSLGVKDWRDGDNNWSLNVSATKLKMSDGGHELPIGTIKLKRLLWIDKIEGDSNSPENLLTDTTIIDDDEAVTIVRSNNSRGEFELIFPEGALEFLIDPTTAIVNNSNGTTYETTITWDLITAP